MSGYQDLFLNQGETFTTDLTLDDTNGRPYDLTNFSVRSQVRKSYYSANATITFDASIPDANTGTIRLSANADITANVSAGKYLYDVVITDSLSNNVTRVLEGQVFITPAVTR